MINLLIRTSIFDSFNTWRPCPK